VTPPFFLLTGAMGGGKSTILGGLKRRGVVCVPEPAREILAEQRSIGADGVPERNPLLFTQLMLSRSLQRYLDFLSHPGPVVFDRGIPDMEAYAGIFGLDPVPFRRAALLHRYHPLVFFFPGWREIYANDDERKIDFEGASEFGRRVKDLYLDLGYQVVDVPLVSAEERVAFVEARLA